MSGVFTPLVVVIMSILIIQLTRGVSVVLTYMLVGFRVLAHPFNCAHWKLHLKLQYLHIVGCGVNGNYLCCRFQTGELSGSHLENAISSLRLARHTLDLLSHFWSTKFFTKDPVLVIYGRMCNWYKELIQFLSKLVSRFKSYTQEWLQRSKKNSDSR